MLQSKKRLLLLLAVLPVLVVLAALAYMVGMPLLEGESRTFWESVQWSAETLSTTGYGADSRWEHPVMAILVIVLQFAGVFLVFLVFPIYLIPFLEERFETRLPKSAIEIDGAVVIWRHGPAVASLIDELERAEVPALVLEEDDGRARRLLESGHRVVYGSLDDGILTRVGLGSARALVANGTDDENAALILGARQLGFEGEILALVEEPFHRKPMMLAGATAVFTPRHILGAALAARASERISPRVEGAQMLGRKLVVSEVRVGMGSVFAGRTLEEAEIGTRTGVTVLGQWVAGRLVAPPAAEMVMEPGGILIVAGSAENVRNLVESCAATTRLGRGGPFVLAGFGEVGQKVAQLLTDAGEEVRVIDREAAEGVDIEGDILDHRVLETASVGDAQSVILAVDSDSATLFATVILKDFAPEVPVIARVNQAQNVERIHRAGADFALSISQVSGQILAGRLLGQQAIALDPKIKVQRVAADGLAGRLVSDLGIRERTGASVVAVERGEELVVELGADFRFADQDEVYICGSTEATRRFVNAFGGG